MLKVCAIMATCGRHHLAERSLRFFLDQDYRGEHTLLIFNNSPVKINEVDLQGEDLFAPNILGGTREINLVNRHIDIQTGKRYTNLGAIYNNALKYVPEDTDIIVHWDDDDIFLPNHLSEGVKGLKMANTFGEFDEVKVMSAYKPAKSYYRHAGGVQLMSNTLEPSIFVSADHIKKYGYSLETTAQHLQWVNPLVYEKKIFVDEEGTPTLIYNWGDVEIPTFKTSGDPNNERNFENYRHFSQDHGDQLLTPWTTESVQRYYNLVKLE